MKLLVSSNKRSQAGSIIILTVVITGLVGLTLASYLNLVKVQNQSTMRSQAWNAAIPVIEAGIEDALTHLNQHASTGLATDGWTKVGDLYWIQRNIGDGYYITTISNYFGPGSSAPVVQSIGYVALPVQVVSASRNTLFAQAGTITSGTRTLVRGVRVTTGREALFAKGLVAKGRIDLNGNNIETDSFDSSDPSYSTAGLYDATKRKDNGDVATNSGLVDSLNVGNADIRGKVSTGPGGSVSIGNNGSVGSSSWHDSSNTGIQPGWSSDDMNVDFPDVKSPFNGGGFTPGAGVVDGIAYTYILSSGNYHMSSLSMTSSKKMIVTGDATLLVTGRASLSGSAQIEIAPGGSLKFYMAGASANLDGNGVINKTGYATNFVYKGLPSNTSLSMGGNGSFVGIVYAPEADFALSGGGSSDNDFTGAAIVKTATMNGHFKFHYDEDLANYGPGRGYIVTTWNEMAPQAVAQFNIEDYYKETYQDTVVYY